MGWWVCAGLIVLTAVAVVQLCRAFTVGKINAGAADFSRSTSPGCFWFQVTLTFIVALLLGFAILNTLYHSLIGR